MSKEKAGLRLSYPHPNMDPHYSSEADREGKNRLVYEVVQVDNSTDYVPGQQLTKREVKDITDLGRFKVSVVKARPPS